MKLTNLLLTAALAGTLLGTGTVARAASNAVPGTVNYVEGSVFYNGQPVSTNQIGSITLGPNESLETRAGKAEVLLTPGVFLRVGPDSTIRMIRPELADTRVDVTRGQAIVEIAELYKENHIVVGLGKSTTLLEKTGIYRFDAQNNSVGVVQGEAAVTENDARAELKKNHEVQVTSLSLKPVKFDGSTEDDLYRWSVLRSQYMADASLQTARTVYVNSYPWFGSGWFWNAGFGAYAWLPGNGFFYDPFGFPFFSPGYVTYAPYVRWPHGRFVSAAPAGVGLRAGSSYRGISAMRAAPAMSMGRGFAGGRR